MFFKRKPRDYQLEDFERSKDLRHFGFLYEMGLGKSKVTIDTGLYLYSKGKINAMVVIAPNGIHTKWAKEDFVNDIPDCVDYKVAIWRSGDRDAMSLCEKLLSPGHHLRIVCMNIESLSRNGSPAELFLRKFLNATDSLLIIDESDTIKNPDAKRTQTILKLGDKASYKRILTGTPINNSVFDLYSQFTFLDTDIFGQSFTSFKHTYANILPPNHPTVLAIMAKGARWVPTLVEKDEDGKPKWKNIDKLQDAIRPYCSVRKKSDHLDLPDKLYESIYYELDKKQRQIYNKLAKEAKVELENDSVTVVHKLTLLLRLQQILAGFLPGDTTEDMISLFKDPMDNPRIQALMTALDNSVGQAIIWCRFTDEIKMIERILGDDCVTYYGETKDRDAKMALYKDGKVRYLVSNTATGGAGLNLTNSHFAIYYSNDFSYRNRAQSEDRQHRLGQKEVVTCLDIVAEDTIDEKIIKILRDKKDVSVQTMRL